MQLFYLHREVDESGVSGVGRVAEGVILHSGKCVLTWFGNLSSIGIYNNIDELEQIHGHGGKTQVIMEPDYNVDIWD